MERGPLIGIVVVAAIGVVVAGVLSWQMSSPIAETPTVVAPATTPSPTPALQAKEAVQPDKAEPDVTAAARTRPRPPRAERAPLPDGPLESTLREVEILFERPLFADLPPDASEAQQTELFQERLADVEELAQSYQDAAREEDDPELMSHAKQQSAHLYERLLEQLPPPPPPYLSGADLDAWAERQDRTIRGLHAKAEAMREDAALAAEQD